MNQKNSIVLFLFFTFFSCNTTLNSEKNHVHFKDSKKHSLKHRKKHFATAKKMPSLQETENIVFDNTKEKTHIEPLKNRLNDKEVYPGLRLVAEVVHLVEQKAYRKVNFKHFIEEALKNSLPFCDPHSSFFSSKSFLETKKTISGKFSGIGVNIISKLPSDDEILVIDVVENGPSHKAGLKPNDKIVEIGGEKLRGLTSDEVINKLQGPAKTVVKIKAIRQKELLDFTITRDVINNETTTAYQFTDHNIVYLSLNLFTENAAASVATVLEKANNKECKGVVIDLRRNPGGLLGSAVDIASFFLPRNSLVVSTKDHNHVTQGTYCTTKNPLLQVEIPIFLLVDNFSASASEILAGCLRHYSNNKREGDMNLMIFILGTQTFGKGSVQEVIPISNNCALKLTTMLYYLPNNESIQATGITPDFLVRPRTIPEDELKWVHEFSGREIALSNHITRKEVDNPDAGQVIEKEDEKGKKDNPEQTWEEKKVKALLQDNFIQSAVSMINMLNFAKSIAPHLVKTKAEALSFLKKHYITDNGAPLSKLVR